VKNKTFQTFQTRKRTTPLATQTVKKPLFFSKTTFSFVLKMEKFIASWLQSPEADEQPALQH